MPDVVDSDLDDDEDTTAAQDEENDSESEAGAGVITPVDSPSDAGSSDMPKPVSDVEIFDEEDTPTTTTSSETESSNTSVSASNSDLDRDHTTVYIGMGVASAVVGVLCVLALLWYRRRGHGISHREWCLKNSKKNDTLTDGELSSEGDSDEMSSKGPLPLVWYVRNTAAGTASERPVGSVALPPSPSASPGRRTAVATSFAAPSNEPARPVPQHRNRNDRKSIVADTDVPSRCRSSGITSPILLDPALRDDDDETVGQPDNVENLVAFSPSSDFLSSGYFSSDFSNRMSSMVQSLVVSMQDEILGGSSSGRSTASSSD